MQIILTGYFRSLTMDEEGFSSSIETKGVDDHSISCSRRISDLQLHSRHSLHFSRTCCLTILPRLNGCPSQFQLREVQFDSRLQLQNLTIVVDNQLLTSINVQQIIFSVLKQIQRFSSFLTPVHFNGSPQQFSQRFSPFYHERSLYSLINACPAQQFRPFH